MKIAVVNLFDPLPGETAREGRYGLLCRTLASRGHEVEWYSSSFSHATKGYRNAEVIGSAAREIGYRVSLAPAGAYRRNVCLARLKSHVKTARQMARIWVSGLLPEVIIVSLPDPSLGRVAAQWARATGAKLIVDVQDLWPETFARFWPKGLRWLNPVVFAGMIRDVNFTYMSADAVVGVASRYVEHCYGRTQGHTLTEVLHLGVTIDEFDRGVRPPDQFGFTKPRDEKWVFLGGAISGYVSGGQAICMMQELQRRGRDDIRLLVVGSGPGREELAKMLRDRRLANVLLLGERNYSIFASLAVASDVALLPVRPETQVYFPNRVFDYFAAGIPIVNTIQGELAGLIAEHGIGLTCSRVAGPCLADAVEQALVEMPISDTDHRRRRGAWVREYDRKGIIARFTGIVEQIGTA